MQPNGGDCHTSEKASICPICLFGSLDKLLSLEVEDKSAILIRVLSIPYHFHSLSAARDVGVFNFVD
jgi:hypothetical protein